MKPTPKPPLFSRSYKIFVLIMMLAILTAIGLPKARQWLAVDAYLEQSNKQT